MEAQINKLSTDIYSLTYNIDSAKAYWENNRQQYKASGEEQKANYSWLALQIIDIHSLYRQIFIKLNINNPDPKKYYSAWCDAEEIEIIASNIKRNFSSFYGTIERIVNQIHILQSIYPYQLFSSSEILIKEEKCSICGTIRDFYNPCGHTKGRLYNGELCCNIVTKCEIVGLAIVTNPVKKYAVLFQQDKNGKEVEYNYDYIYARMHCWSNPYAFWNYYIIDNVIGKIIRFYTFTY